MRCDRNPDSIESYMVSIGLECLMYADTDCCVSDAMERFVLSRSSDAMRCDAIVALQRCDAARCDDTDDATQDDATPNQTMGDFRRYIHPYEM